MLGHWMCIISAIRHVWASQLKLYKFPVLTGWRRPCKGPFFARVTERSFSITNVVRALGQSSRNDHKDATA